MNNGFKIYVVPVSISDNQTVGLISAFFDDEDEPLIIRTPLFEDEDDRLRQLLLCKRVDVHLFMKTAENYWASKRRCNTLRLRTTY